MILLLTQGMSPWKDPVEIHKIWMNMERNYSIYVSLTFYVYSTVELTVWEKVILSISLPTFSNTYPCSSRPFAPS